MSPVESAGVDALPDDARVWIFGADREPTGAETEEVLRAVDGFLGSWAAHGVPLRAARSWLHGRFLVVGADVRASAPSGCSIDALAHLLQELEGRLGVRFLGHDAVYYRDDAGAVRRVDRPGFRALARAGRVTPETVVFDTSVTRRAEVRAGRWEAPAATRWHRAFFD